MKHSQSVSIKHQLDEKHLRQLRKDRELIARELPELVAKHQRLCQAADEPTLSGQLRQAIHASKLLLDDLADQTGTTLKKLDAFLTGDATLPSDVIDRLTGILKLKLASANGKPRGRRAKAG